MTDKKMASMNSPIVTMFIFVTCDQTPSQQMNLTLFSSGVRHKALSRSSVSDRQADGKRRGQWERITSLSYYIGICSFPGDSNLTNKK